jgi:hypothetical protein
MCVCVSERPRIDCGLCPRLRPNLCFLLFLLGSDRFAGHFLLLVHAIKIRFSELVGAGRGISTFVLLGALFYDTQMVVINPITA